MTQPTFGNQAHVCVCFVTDLMKLGRVLHIQKKATTEEKADQECVLTSLIPALAFDFHSVVSYLLKSTLLLKSSRLHGLVEVADVST